MTEPLVVTQADRDAAADFCSMIRDQTFSSKYVTDGERDQHALVQAFARHRLAALTPDTAAIPEKMREALERLFEQAFRDGKQAEREGADDLLAGSADAYARSAILAMSTPAPVPATREGWVCVPVEPTETMIEAAEGAHRLAGCGFYEGAETAELWSAMLAAAPRAPQSHAGDGWRTMDSAPRDGTVFMVWATYFEWPEIVRWAEYDRATAAEAGESGYWRYAEGLLADYTDDACSEAWTHWRPVPVAPTNDRAEVGE